MNSDCLQVIKDTPAASEVVYHADGHNFRLESLRGSNRNQRVEHLRCPRCDERRTRVWFDIKAGRPDREYRRAS